MSNLEVSYEKRILVTGGAGVSLFNKIRKAIKFLTSTFSFLVYCQPCGHALGSKVPKLPYS